MEKSLRHQIGQMIIAGFPSLEVDDQARRLVEEYQVGNFILFARNMKYARQTAALCDGLSRMTFEKLGVAPFISADQEGGMVSRITEGAALFSGAMALSAGADLQQARQVGKNCGQMLRSMGINVNFAPVLDVNIAPMNPIIGNRSYGDDPQRVADVGCAVMEGMVEGGVIATLKHYPGHGNVNTDSHLDLPVNHTDPKVLEQTEFLPFQQAFDRGAPALMSCHIVFPKIDPELPATLSPVIIGEMLRKKQGFDGLVFTDCMEMDAIQKGWGTAQGAVLAVAAGCDVLCISHHIEAVQSAVEAIEQAVADGIIPRSRIQESYDRIMAAKKKMGLLEPQQVSLEQAEAIIHDAEKIALHKQVARSSVTLLADKGGLSALQKAKKPMILAPVFQSSTGVEDKEYDGRSFARSAGTALGWDFVEFPMTPSEEERAAALAAVSQADALVLGLYNCRFRETQRALVEQVCSKGIPVTVALLGAPYDMPHVQSADAVLCCYEYTPLAVSALVEAMQSGEFTGKLPIKL